MSNSDLTYYILIADNRPMIDVWKGEDKPIMQCGHTANALLQFPNSEALQKETDDMRENIPVHVCVICDTKITTEKSSLEGRKARCSGCKREDKSETDSRWNLPFFKHKPNSEFDEYYCGCWGWN